MVTVLDITGHQPIYIHTSDGMRMKQFSVEPSTYDLSCNNITIRQAADVGSAYIVSIPSGAKIYIDNVEQVGLVTPATINNIPSAPSEHMYKLVKPGYVDTEGILFITTGQTYNVTVTMCQTSGNIWPLLIGAAIIGILLSRRKKEEYKPKEYKPKE